MRCNQSADKDQDRRIVDLALIQARADEQPGIERLAVDLPAVQLPLLVTDDRDREYEVAAEIVGERDITISVHCHNDLGLAVANSLAAVEAERRVLVAALGGQTGVGVAIGGEGGREGRGGSGQDEDEQKAGGRQLFRAQGGHTHGGGERQKGAQDRHERRPELARQESALQQA